MNHQEKLVKYCESELQAADAELAAWKKKLEENPAEAFEWSLRAFEAAARQHVAKNVQRMIKADGNQIKERLEELVVHGASYPEMSTSPTSNLMKSLVVAKYAVVLGEMKYMD